MSFDIYYRCYGIKSVHMQYSVKTNKLVTSPLPITASVIATSGAAIITKATTANILRADKNITVFISDFELIAKKASMSIVTPINTSKILRNILFTSKKLT